MSKFIFSKDTLYMEANFVAQGFNLLLDWSCMICAETFGFNNSNQKLLVVVLCFSKHIVKPGCPTCSHRLKPFIYIGVECESGISDRKSEFLWCNLVNESKRQAQTFPQIKKTLKNPVKDQISLYMCVLGYMLQLCQAYAISIMNFVFYTTKMMWL